MRREGHSFGRVGIIYVCVANKIYLRALPETLPTSIAEVTCECNLPAEVTCPESSRESRVCSHVVRVAGGVFLF